LGVKKAFSQRLKDIEGWKRNRFLLLSIEADRTFVHSTLNCVTSYRTEQNRTEQVLFQTCT